MTSGCFFGVLCQVPLSSLWLQRAQFAGWVAPNCARTSASLQLPHLSEQALGKALLATDTASSDTAPASRLAHRSRASRARSGGGWFCVMLRRPGRYQAPWKEEC